MRDFPKCSCLAAYALAPTPYHRSSRLTVASSARVPAPGPGLVPPGVCHLDSPGTWMPIPYASQGTDSVPASYYHLCLIDRGS